MRHLLCSDRAIVVVILLSVLALVGCGTTDAEREENLQRAKAAAAILRGGIEELGEQREQLLERTEVDQAVVARIEQELQDAELAEEQRAEALALLAGTQGRVDEFLADLDRVNDKIAERESALVLVLEEIERASSQEEVAAVILRELGVAASGMLPQHAALISLLTTGVGAVITRIGTKRAERRRADAERAEVVRRVVGTIEAGRGEALADGRVAVDFEAVGRAQDAAGVREDVRAVRKASSTRSAAPAAKAKAA